MGAAKSRTTGDGLLDCPAPIAHLRSGKPVAAWLLKAAPGVWDAEAAMRSGTPIDTWSMADTYRVQMIQPGQPCGLWMTRGWPSTAAGISAIGRITSAPYWSAAADDGLWTIGQKAESARWHIDIDLQILSVPVALDDLAGDPDFRRAEIIRAPRVSTPVALTPSEWAVVCALVAVSD